MYNEEILDLLDTTRDPESRVIKGRVQRLEGGSDFKLVGALRHLHLYVIKMKEMFNFIIDWKILFTCLKNERNFRFRFSFTIHVFKMKEMSDLDEKIAHKDP